MTIWLSLQLFWHRQHMLFWLLAGLLSLGLFLYGYWLPVLLADRHSTALDLLQAQQQMSEYPREMGTSLQKLHGFQRLLGEGNADLAQQTLFNTALKTGLVLEEASYERIFEPKGLYQQVRITLPVKGSYPAIRQFCERVLLALPYASLDRVSFKRDNAGFATISATLVFVLFVKPGQDSRRQAHQWSMVNWPELEA